MLKNVHLASKYCSQLEKQLHAKLLEAAGNKAFRIFLTSEISPKLPANLLVRSHTLVFEPSQGIKPGMLRIMDQHRKRQEQQGVTGKGPSTLPRLHFLAMWLHGVIVERLRYCPLGWTKTYEIGEGHFRRMIETIDSWVYRVADGKDIAPKDLPWQALFVLLGQSVYGGGIDNEFDGELLKSFLKQFFSPASYQGGFKLSGSYEGRKPLTIAGGPGAQSFDDWIRELPEEQHPVWLGLPGMSQKMVQTQQGQAMLADLVKIQDLFEGGDDDEDDEEPPASPPGSPGNWKKKTKKEAAKSEKEGTYIPEWARKLTDTVEGFLRQLGPAVIDKKSMHADLWDTDSENPISQALRSEVDIACRLMKQVQQELKNVVAVCLGEAKPTNVIREMMAQLGKEIIPPRWRKYIVIPTMTVSPWIADFAERCKLLSELGSCPPPDYQKRETNLGMLLFPGAYITATRQAVARKLQYPLEKLVMSIDLGKSGKEGEAWTADGGSFLLSGLGLQGASLDGGKLRILRDQLRWRLGTHRLWWRKQEKAIPPRDSLELPLYLNRARTELLAKLQLPIDASTPSYEWMQMGAAVTAWIDPSM